MHRKPQPSPEHHRPQSSSLYVDQIIFMQWNPTGTSLCTATNHQLRIWHTHQAKVYQGQLRQLQANALALRYGSEHMLGGVFGDGVRFWDLRDGVNRAAMMVGMEINSARHLFDVSMRRNEFTVGDRHNLGHYDFRNPKKSGCLLAETQSETPFFALKWSDNYDFLLAGGGQRNRGIITVFDEKIQRQKDFDLLSTEIINISMDSQSTLLAAMGHDNLVMLFQLPELICKGIISVPEEQFIEGCQISKSGQYMTVNLDNQVWVYEWKNTRNTVRKVPIAYYSPCSWNPIHDYISFMPDGSSNQVAIIKIKD